MPTISPSLILTIHQSLCRENLVSKFPRRTLPLFLRWAHERVKVGWKDDKIDDTIRKIVTDIGIVSEYNNFTTDQTISAIKNDALDWTTLLGGLKVGMEELLENLNAQAKVLREQYNAVSYHKSIDESLKKFGDRVDVDALKFLQGQLFQFHAEQLATANSVVVEQIRSFIEMISRAL